MPEYKKLVTKDMKIAYILGVENNIDFRTGRLGCLPLDNNEANVVYCIEVLEHVY
jgi:2-polyprenyl-3-methyl-5-hydroxy-6-metoxy-1,4-benzoquinol methylase